MSSQLDNERIKRELIKLDYSLTMVIDHLKSPDIERRFVELDDGSWEPCHSAVNAIANINDLDSSIFQAMIGARSLAGVSGNSTMDEILRNLRAALQLICEDIRRTTAVCRHAQADEAVMVQRELEFRPVGVSELLRASCHSRRGILPRRFIALLPIPKE